MNYPKQLIKDYAERKTTRAQFTRQFTDWQKANGVNYDCRGYGYNGHICLMYRGVKGEIRNGVIFWNDAANHEHLAQSVIEFKRFVDQTKAAAKCTAH